MSAYRDIYNASPSYRIKLIRDGIKRTRLRVLARALGIHEAVLAADLRIRAGVSARIAPAPSERVIGLMSLIGRVETMLASSGVSGFNAGKWLGAWLNAPLPALGGARPGSYLDTMVGQDLLGELIAKAESGAYA
jgi:uncharacterized protein (DUF2384 family)